SDLLGFAGDVKDRPASTFLMTHGENFQPKPDLLAAAAGKAFLGVQLQCAECHDHPFAPWKQADFWGVAAFFGKVRNTRINGPPYVLTEDADPKPLDVKNGGSPRPTSGPGGAITIPGTGGNKGAGEVVAAKVLGGKPLTLDDAAPFRPTFVEWATGRENPYFARAFVNRAWAQLFGRGLVHAVDNLHADNPPSHPELLDLLAREFADSEFDVKHLYRCVCNSNAYQRSSRALPGNEKDALLLSKMAVKPIGPEAIYNSIETVLGENKNASGGGKAGGNKPAGTKPAGTKPAAGKPASPAVSPRDEFVNFFRGQGGAEPGEFAHGIPQFLRRMNGAQFNAGAPMIERLVKEQAK